MSRPTILFHQLTMRAICCVPCKVVLCLGLLTAAAQAQFGELLPPSGGTPPSTGTTLPNTNPFDLPPVPTTPPGSALNPPTGGLTPPGGGLTPAPNNNPLPDINLTAPGGTPGDTTTPTVDEAALREKAKLVSELIKAEKYTEAEEILNKEIAENPKDAGAWYFLAGRNDSKTSTTRRLSRTPRASSISRNMATRICGAASSGSRKATMPSQFSISKSPRHSTTTTPALKCGADLAVNGWPDTAGDLGSLPSDQVRFALRASSRQSGFGVHGTRGLCCRLDRFQRSDPVGPNQRPTLLQTWRGVCQTRSGGTGHRFVQRRDPPRSETRRSLLQPRDHYAQLGKSAEAASDRAKAMQLNPTLTQSRR